MGKSEPSISTTPKSDSGYGDDAVSATTVQDDLQNHPLARKGYEIGPASNLQIGDVFEFLWADTHEFEWEWKCLGYNRFIVLRHSDTFPHHCVCIPISNGGKIEFAKPGMDSSQQGYIYAEGEVPAEGDRHRLPYSPISIELKPGKLRVKEDSRVNYADILEIDHDSQVMVVGDVARYFDRVRRNVNKATMRKVLVQALEAYRAQRNGEAAKAALAGNQDNRQHSTNAPPPPPPETYHPNYSSEYAKAEPKPSDSQITLRLPRSRSPTYSIRSRAEPRVERERERERDQRAGLDRRSSQDQDRRHQKQREQQRGKDRDVRSKKERGRERENNSLAQEEEVPSYRLSHPEQDRRKEFPKQQQLPRSNAGQRQSQGQSQSQSQTYCSVAAGGTNNAPSSIALLRQGGPNSESNYDLRSMHNVAHAGWQ